MIVAVHQPQYMPWLGYFDKIDKADIFVLLDTVQFKKNEWQNRNKIKTAQGWQWLTVPVLYKFPEKIEEVAINNNSNWQNLQRKSLKTNYSKSLHFNHIIELLDEVFSAKWDRIAPLNIFTVKEVARILGISTPIHVASELGEFPDDPDDRLIAISQYFDGTTYLAGSGGKDYMKLEKYERAGIKVQFQEFHHPVYPQLFGPFEPFMSVLDLLFNCGPDSLSFLRGDYECSGDRRAS
ncbi:MAG: WbqC family protein [Pseudomonadota bacterium]